MLDRQLLVKKLEAISKFIFKEENNLLEMAWEKWQEISSDPNFIIKVLNAESSFLLPRWEGELSSLFKVDPIDNYSVLAVDGSQIYPDRHFSGATCFVVNVGGCLLSYEKDKDSEVRFFTEPLIFLPHHLSASGHFFREAVDFKREEEELRFLLEQSEKWLKKNDSKDFVAFLDGTLIFWMLEGRWQEEKEGFLQGYLKLLELFFKKRIPVAGYISFPKSRELINLIKIGFCKFEIPDCIACYKEGGPQPCRVIDSLLDVHIVRKLFKDSKDKYYRTLIFESCSQIVEEYPDYLRPSFFYLDVGEEIVRIEIPAWVAKEKRLVEMVSSIALDQAIKGNGYPVVLAEAHQQAVIKKDDRDFFYSFLSYLAIKHNRHVSHSPKSRKKRFLEI